MMNAVMFLTGALAGPALGAGHSLDDLATVAPPALPPEIAAACEQLLLGDSGPELNAEVSRACAELLGAAEGAGPSAEVALACSELLRAEEGGQLSEELALACELLLREGLVPGDVLALDAPASQIPEAGQLTSTLEPVLTPPGAPRALLGAREVFSQPVQLLSRPLLANELPVRAPTARSLFGGARKGPARLAILQAQTVERSSAEPRAARPAQEVCSATASELFGRVESLSAASSEESSAAVARSEAPAEGSPRPAPDVGVPPPGGILVTISSASADGLGVDPLEVFGVPAGTVFVLHPLGAGEEPQASPACDWGAPSAAPRPVLRPKRDPVSLDPLRGAELPGVVRVVPDASPGACAPKQVAPAEACQDSRRVGGDDAAPAGHALAAGGGRSQQVTERTAFASSLLACEDRARVPVSMPVLAERVRIAAAASACDLPERVRVGGQPGATLRTSDSPRPGAGEERAARHITAVQAPGESIPQGLRTRCEPSVRPRAATAPQRTRAAALRAGEVSCQDSQQARSGPRYSGRFVLRTSCASADDMSHVPPSARGGPTLAGT